MVRQKNKSNKKIIIKVMNNKITLIIIITLTEIKTHTELKKT